MDTWLRVNWLHSLRSPLRLHTRRQLIGLAALGFLWGSAAYSSLAHAAEELTGLRISDAVVLFPHGQYRPRFLAHGGRDLKPGGNFEAFSHRARLGLEGRFLQLLSASLELQDVRLWGEETNTLGDYAADGLDLHQAWLELRSRGGLYLCIGRQEILLDNERLVGAVGFSDQGRSFDGAVLGLAVKGWLEARLLYAKIGEADAYLEQVDAQSERTVIRGSPRDADLAGVWLRFTPLPWLRPSLTALYDRRGDLPLDRATIGLYIDGDLPLGFSHAEELYLQLGRQGSGAGEESILAFLGAVRLSYMAPLPLSPGLTGWLDFLSGDDDAQDGTRRVFDTLFATNHKFYGFMDFFTNIPLHTSGLGLMDAGARLSAQPLRGFTAWIDWHHLRLARSHPSGRAFLGNELDLLLRYSLNPFLTFEGVLGALVPGKALTALKGGDQTELFGYLQADLRF